MINVFSHMRLSAVLLTLAVEITETDDGNRRIRNCSVLIVYTTLTGQMCMQIPEPIPSEIAQPCGIGALKFSRRTFLPAQGFSLSK